MFMVSDKSRPTEKSNQDDDSGDYNLKVLETLPEAWDTSQKEMHLHIIANIEDATWVARKVFEDIDRGLINANLMIKKSEHSCDMFVDIKSVLEFGSAVATVLTFLLKELKSELVKRRKKELDEKRYLAGIY
jgi:hypothetical protein